MPYIVTYTNNRTGKRITPSKRHAKTKAAAKRDKEDLKRRMPGCNPRLKKL